MKPTIYTLVGTTELAVANALLWHVALRPNLHGAKIIYCVTKGDEERQTRGSETIMPKVTALLEEYRDHFPFLAKQPLEICEEPVVVTEENFEQNVRTLVDVITENNEPESSIYLDSTTGRKLMGASMVTAGYVLKTLGFNVHLMYYWLKLFRQDLLKKKAYELTPDEVESVDIDLSVVEGVIKNYRS